MSFLTTTILGRWMGKILVVGRLGSMSHRTLIVAVQGTRALMLYAPSPNSIAQNVYSGCRIL